MEFVPLIAMSFLVGKFMDLLKALTNKAWNAALTILIGWAAGVAVVFAFAHSDFAAGLNIGDTGPTLAELNPVSLVIVGMNVASIFGFLHDYKKARTVNEDVEHKTLLPTASKKKKTK